MCLQERLQTAVIGMSCPLYAVSLALGFLIIFGAPAIFLKVAFGITLISAPVSHFKLMSLHLRSKAGQSPSGCLVPRFPHSLSALLDVEP